MTERAARTRIERRDRGRALSARVPSVFSRPLRCAGSSPPCSCSPRSTSRAQGPAPRPWLDWHTVETEHFVLHYPSAYREWTLVARAAHRVGAERGRRRRRLRARRVACTSSSTIPINDANGYAFTTLDAPTIVLWPVSPDPRSEIGDYAVWQDLLATHEFAHVAHLTRPSRNRWQRLLRRLSPVPLGPIATKAPRWVMEGYATYVEGRVSGTGRPNHAWRAAILRQFALEGRLPSYGQLSSTGGWKGGEFAYLAGSAFLEWLARREGDSSVVALWRRMTAKTDRSFECGVRRTSTAARRPSCTGGSSSSSPPTPSRSRAQLRRQQLTEGALVQRLVRSTGDPAIAPDGRFVALTIRKEKRRARWSCGGRQTSRIPLAAAQAREPAPTRPGGRARPQLLSARQEGGRDARRRATAIRTRRRAGSPTTAAARLAQHARARRHRPARSVRLERRGRNLSSPHAARGAARRRSLRGRPMGRRRPLRARLVRPRSRRPRRRASARAACREASPATTIVRASPGRTGEIVVAEQLGDRWRIARVSPDDRRAPLRRSRRRREPLRRDLRRRRRRPS